MRVKLCKWQKPQPPTVEAVLAHTLWAGYRLTDAKIAQVIDETIIDTHLICWLGFREYCKRNGCTPYIVKTYLMLKSDGPIERETIQRVRRTYKRWYNERAEQFYDEVVRDAARRLDSLSEEEARVTYNGR